MRTSRLVVALTLLAAPLARGDPMQAEFLLLPSAEAVGTFDRQAPVTQITDEVLKLDSIFSLQSGAFKLFGEYLVSDHEGDLERFQIGWQASSDTVVWIGRYHQPTSIWNHEHHHGQYLQTSITRPAIDEWEDLGGVLPQHFTGVLIESSKTVFGDWRLHMAAAGGIAPELNHEGLEPFDLVHPDHDRRQMGYQARASLHPGEFTETGFGMIAADDGLSQVGPQTAEMLGLNHVNLRLLGVFGTYAAHSWKILGTAYYANARLYYTGSQIDDHFEVGYVQGEWHLQYDLTTFARLEESAHASDSAYLSLFDEFHRSRQLAGLRWDFAHRQALTVELGRTHTLQGAFSDVRLQWSAAVL
jgi:hypothetical protein